jgi:two-component system, OmpR family, KDP operon response regulator KdpE
MVQEALRVLIIDDEVQIRRLLQINLTTNGYEPVEASTGQEALRQAAHWRPDLILLDLGLPDVVGLTVLERLREWTQVPVIVLSVRGTEQDKIAALDRGADDYLTKPFGIGELLARLRVAHRHAQPAPEPILYTKDDICVDLTSRQVTVKGAPIKLTPTEYNLLRLLVQHAGKVVTHRQLLSAVWGEAYVHEIHCLRVYFAQLRQKLEANPALPQLILTEPGIGYRLAH